MIPTDIQKKAIQTMIGVMQTWLDTNDIDSPTHCVDIEELTQVMLADKVCDKELKEVQQALVYSLATIRNVGTGFGRMIHKMSHDELIDLVRDVFDAKGFAKASGCQEASKQKELWQRYKVLEDKLKRYALSPATKPW